MKKIISIVGNRPNYIKLAAIGKFLSKNFSHVIINTGQHYDYSMTGNFFKEFNFPPINYDLKVGSSQPGLQIAKIISKSESVILKEKPDAVIVYGDTNSTLGGAIATVKQSIKCIHIESGLRSFDKSMSEEINRILVDHMSDLLFCSSKIALKNLKKENISKNAYFVGDVMLDLLLRVKGDVNILKTLSVTSKNYYYCTIHRQENSENLSKLTKLFSNLESLNKPVILPLHPRTKKALSRANIKLNNVKIITPLNYSENVFLLKNSQMILTDSGGIQKEAYWMEIPCLTLRHTTEWPETLKAGWNKLVGDNFSQTTIDNFEIPNKHPDFYGHGNSSKTVVNLIKNYL